MAPLPSSGARVDRRTLLASAGALLLAGCSDGGGGGGPSAKAKPSPSGPIVRQQDAGTVIGKADIDELVGRLDAALRDADVSRLRETAPGIKTAEWRRRLRNIARFPMSDIGFAFDESYDRQVNASGGPLDIDANLVLTHRIAGVDARPVTQVYRAGLHKESPDAPVHLTELTGPHDDTSPAPWDLSDWEVLEGDHVVLTARPDDVARARATLGVIDRGAERAMQVIAPPAGVRKVFVALADPGDPLYAADGATRIGEYAGVAFRAGYVDPEEAARTGKGAGKDAAYASSRLLLHPSAFGSTAGLEDVAMHETIHAMAYQWGDGDPWVAEGLARWAEAGFAAGLRSDGGYRASIVSGFAGFRRRMRGTAALDHDVFHDKATEADNYNCAAAVYGYLESAGGRSTALRFARAAYSSPVPEAVKKVGARDLDGLFAKAERWVAGL